MLRTPLIQGKNESCISLKTKIIIILLIELLQIIPWPINIGSFIATSMQDVILPTTQNANQHDCGDIYYYTYLAWSAMTFTF